MSNEDCLPEEDDELSDAIAALADLQPSSGKTKNSYTTKTSQAIAAASSKEEDRSFRARVAMEHARLLIVHEGMGVEQAAKKLGVRPSILKKRVDDEGWLAERERLAAIEQRAEDNTDIADQNLALKEAFRNKLLAAKQRLDLIERAVHLRLLDAVGNTTEVTFTDVDGNTQTIRVPNAREGTFEALLHLNKAIIDQANVLTNYVEPQAEATAKRLKRSKFAAVKRLQAVASYQKQSEEGEDDGTV